MQASLSTLPSVPTPLYWCHWERNVIKRAFAAAGIVRTKDRKHCGWSIMCVCACSLLLLLLLFAVCCLQLLKQCCDVFRKLCYSMLLLFSIILRLPCSVCPCIAE